MKLLNSGELSLLESLKKRFHDKSEGLVLGIGDDAAVIKTKESILLTTDMMVEGVHFDLSWTTAFQLGYKLIAVNISDIYAMGGSPKFILLNFSAPGNTTTDFFDELFRGVRKALNEYGVILIGGDISSSDSIMLSVTALGSAKKILRRSGAKAGDKVYVTGNLGDSACGLDLLKIISKPLDLDRKRYKGLPLDWDIVKPLVKRQLMPLVKNAEPYSRSATSMMDISDGLLIDISRLCKESRVGVNLYIDKIPMSELLKAASVKLARDPLAYALSGGEDYELLFTAPHEKVKGAFCIGEITKSGMFMIDSHHKKKRISIRGYEHFSLQR